MLARRLLPLLLFFANSAIASPWMTGPLHAASGKTIPKGHVNVEPYAFYTVYPQHYRNVELLPILTVGVTNFLDIQTSLPYDYSWDQGQNGNDIGDYSLGMGVQVWREEANTWVPNLRLTLQEVFPTGRYDNLNRLSWATDQTGIGAYQTSVGFHFQKLKDFGNDHFLRTRLGLVETYASNVHVDGVSAFGGTADTHGKVNPGIVFLQIWHLNILSPKIGCLYLKHYM